MSYDYVDCGPNPAEEPSVHDRGEPTRDQETAELERYKALLVAKFPVPEVLKDRVRFVIKTHDHDFGGYRDVGVKFHRTDSLAGMFAYFCQDHAPGRWTETEPVVFDVAAAEARLTSPIED